MTRLVSWIDSPLAIDENVKPVVSHTEPPRRQNAAPKLTRVRVLASKNRLASTAPSSTRVTFWRRAMGRITSASRNRSSADSRLNWSTDSTWRNGPAVSAGVDSVYTRCVEPSARDTPARISSTKRRTTSGIARNSFDSSGSSQLSRARRRLPMRSANASRVMSRRRMASRRRTCCVVMSSH